MDNNTQKLDELAEQRPPKAMAVPATARPRFPTADRVALTLDGSDQEVVEALGAGVLMLWNDLPQDIQRQIFDSATQVLSSDHSKKVREELALFLHDHKDD